MKIDVKNIVSISDANKNFSQVVKKLNDSEMVLILKNNKPKYTLTNYESTFSIDDKIELVARRILQEHEYAFKELAK